MCVGGNKIEKGIQALVNNFIHIRNIQILNLGIIINYNIYRIEYNW